MTDLYSHLLDHSPAPSDSPNPRVDEQTIHRNRLYQANPWVSELDEEALPLLEFLDKMNDFIEKDAQVNFFNNNLHSLSLSNLEKLAIRMREIQEESVGTEPFDWVRHEQNSLFFTSGDTRSWQKMRSALKAEMVSRIAYQNILHSPEKISFYRRIFASHSSRFLSQSCFSCFFQTSSSKVFEQKLEQARCR